MDWIALAYVTVIVVLLVVGLVQGLAEFRVQRRRAALRVLNGGRNSRRRPRGHR